jgi:hypothetical protein
MEGLEVLPENTAEKWLTSSPLITSLRVNNSSVKEFISRLQSQVLNFFSTSTVMQ